MRLTEDMLRRAFPQSRAADRTRFLPYLNICPPQWGIDTPGRLRAFLAQTGHESGQLRTLSENLNYSAEALRRVFPKYFPTAELAAAYARNPERIASRVYAGRLGNGDEKSGDGWRYRGRGLIQITGRDNYRAIGEACREDFLTQPDLVAMAKFAVMTACAWWKENGLNELCDGLEGADGGGAFERITRRINGGVNGLPERRRLYGLARRYVP